jgi:GNAT superfamily N-acetyltransferase
MSSMEPRIFPAATPADIQAARALMREYGESLDIDLGYQGFERELAGLPGDYAPPRGRLLLAESGGRIAGCGALRPRSAGVCEMKRLFVRPGHRGKKIGFMLAAALIAEARAIGYRAMQLDTLPSMRDAVRLYTSLGFAPRMELSLRVASVR